MKITQNSQSLSAIVSDCVILGKGSDKVSFGHDVAMDHHETSPDTANTNDNPHNINEGHFQWKSLPH